LANLTRMMQSEFRWMLTSQDAEGGGVTGDVIVNVTKKYEQKGQPDAP